MTSGNNMKCLYLLVSLRLAMWPYKSPCSLVSLINVISLSNITRLNKLSSHLPTPINSQPHSRFCLTLAQLYPSKFYTWSSCWASFGKLFIDLKQKHPSLPPFFPFYFRDFGLRPYLKDLEYSVSITFYFFILYPERTAETVFFIGSAE